MRASKFGNLVELTIISVCVDNYQCLRLYIYIYIYSVYSDRERERERVTRDTKTLTNVIIYLTCGKDIYVLLEIV